MNLEHKLRKRSVSQKNTYYDEGGRDGPKTATTACAEDCATGYIDSK